MCHVIIDPICSWVSYELITAPHRAHASFKLLFGCETLALQELHLLLFAPAINLEVIEISSGHGHPSRIGLRSTATKQVGSDNADAKYGNEPAHGSLHSHAHFARVDGVQTVETHTN